MIIKEKKVFLFGTKKVNYRPTYNKWLTFLFNSFFYIRCILDFHRIWQKKGRNFLFIIEYWINLVCIMQKGHFVVTMLCVNSNATMNLFHLDKSWIITQWMSFFFIYPIAIGWISNDFEQPTSVRGKFFYKLLIFFLH